MTAAQTQDRTANTRLITAFKALALSSPPGDWQSGASSTTWTPMATAIAAEVAGKPAFQRWAVYSQVLNLIAQAEQQVLSLGLLAPAERRQMLGFFAALRTSYRKLEGDAQSEHAAT